MLMNILLWLVFGALIGWIAGKIMRAGLSAGWAIAMGILGSVVGGFIATLLGLGSLTGAYRFDFWNIVISVAGACLVIWIVGMMRGHDRGHDHEKAR